MCIILGEVYKVAKTKLFVLANNDKSRQMTFYSNIVGTPEENMMILPVPSGPSHPPMSGGPSHPPMSGGPSHPPMSDNNQIKLHTLEYKTMFEDLRLSVATIHKKTLSNHSRSLSASLLASASIPLEVFHHGSYLVSIAPQIEDLFRLDTSIFEFTPTLFDFFAKHYTREFGYICCVLKPGTKKYEPLCYSHPLHSSKKLFVPTLHYHNHDGEIHTDKADWDHLLYSVGTEEKANRGYTSKSSNNVEWRHFPKEFQKRSESSIRCAEIQGHYPNMDISFDLY